jgi:hypothetical protein
MIDNAEWLDQIKWIEFLRDYGKHFTINKMIAQETVRRRLDNEEPYTFLEFNYMLLQSYDFLELARRFDCRIQMGGSDQWGNIVNGIDLTRRIIDKQVFGVTTPLITTASGGKMGKTAEGAVWLNAGDALALRLLAVLAQQPPPSRREDAPIHLPQRCALEEESATVRFPPPRGAWGRWIDAQHRRRRGLCACSRCKRSARFCARRSRSSKRSTSLRKLVQQS